MSNFITKRLHFLAILALGASALGAMGNWHWFAELFSHFMPHYTLCFALAACTAQIMIRRVFWAACTLLSLVWLTMPHTTWTVQAAYPMQNKLLWYNVNLNNADPIAESTMLLTQNADTLALAEIQIDDMRWQGLRQSYPYGCTHQDTSPFALAVWTKIAPQSCTLFFVDEIPYVRAQLHNGTVIYALHPPPPINRALAQTQRDYLQQVATKIAQETAPVIVVGDLNTTAFSPVMRDFVAQSNVQAALPYYTPTWQPFGLAIDHVLSRNIKNIQTQTLPWQHSDHRALMATW